MNRLFLLPFEVGSKPDTTDQVYNKQRKYHKKQYIMDAIVFVFVLEPYNSRMQKTYSQTYKEAKHQAGNQCDPTFKIKEVSVIVPCVSANGLIHDIASDQLSHCRYHSPDYENGPWLFDLKEFKYSQDNKESYTVNRKPGAK